MLGDDNASKSSTKGVDERKREGSVNRRSSQYVKKSTRWYWRGEDETTQNKLRVEVSKAMAQLVRHGHKRQVRLEQQRIVEEIKGQGNLRSLDDEALLVMIRMAVRDSSPGDDKIKFVFQDEADETSCIASRQECRGKRAKVALSMVQLAQSLRDSKGPKLD